MNTEPLTAENARLRAAVADLQAELGVWKVQSINEAERAREEVERLRADFSVMEEAALRSQREAERLRADLERLAVETMGITAAGAKAYGEAERLRESRDSFRRLYDAEFAEAERLRAALAQYDGLIDLAVQCLRECDDEGADELDVARNDIKRTLAGTEATTCGTCGKTVPMGCRCSDG